MTTDFRALCADLVRVADALDGRTPLTSNQGQALDGYSALAEFRHVADRARAALADEPAVPEGREPVAVIGQPSDGDLDVLMYSIPWKGSPSHWGRQVVRAALTRWGNPAPVPPADGEVAELVQQLHHAAEVDGWDGASPEWCQSMLRAAELLQRQALVPVPVSERLPGPEDPEDCDAEGRCWYWRPSHPESGYSEGWVLRPSSWGVGHYDFDDSVIHTHWLPAHVLPLPEVK